MNRDTLRLDKWFWYARFIKSRSLATKLCNSGKVRVNGNLIKKAHQSVTPGDVLTFSVGPNIRVIKIIKLGNRRGPAKEAQALYEDLQPIDQIAKKIDSTLAPEPAKRERGSGRPTKVQRRAIERFMGWLKGI
ncbi:MAG TPA: RNA-binding S4 domain-containing protein [Rhodospirillales bacterium]|jgi:ribosome-associated heat shock protein Hsp15|nr:MAG: Heat shock protein 15 [Alphaproteobacteria bacterium MarineAlpha3_Bin6]HHZ75125.1 RNA-binding S4 domain-containing protein [Rhodospirillales bacterium]HIA82501.1 RNA-binding S4 domain-containing protein [Rhodospirillales bacterium]HIC60200.1 RNA-binding S4 domain-containing protein [Rhodospirillales bacterium]HIN75495.1 RNA-binding S4 domain-containing protein [Rhodospirillales bacterium]|tara:strand:+ start:231 stop:629 length:399 start_codon:yes stop_codon:yes gene_type:complete